MERLVSEIHLLVNGGIPDEYGLSQVFSEDSGWPHYCALNRIPEFAAKLDLVLLDNGGVPDDRQFRPGLMRQPEIHVPRPVVAWFVVTSFLLAVAGNT
jgi:hypothetical protein